MTKHREGVGSFLECAGKAQRRRRFSRPLAKCDAKAVSRAALATAVQKTNEENRMDERFLAVVRLANVVAAVVGRGCRGHRPRLQWRNQK